MTPEDLPQGAPCATGVLVAVTDHAVERFHQRVASRRGALDRRPEIVQRVGRAWAAGRTSTRAPGRPPHADEPASRPGTGGTLYVGDLLDRDLVFVCRLDRRSRELLVITVWEQERLGAARVPRRFTDALTPRPRPAR